MDLSVLLPLPLPSVPNSSALSNLCVCVRTRTCSCFVSSINTILEFLPKQRRTGLFSATQTQEVENLVRAGLRNPVRISVKEKGVAASSTQKTPSRLENYYMVSVGPAALSCALTIHRDGTDFRPEGRIVWTVSSFRRQLPEGCWHLWAGSPALKLGWGREEAHLPMSDRAYWYRAGVRTLRGSQLRPS